MAFFHLSFRSCFFPCSRNPKLTVLCTDISQTFDAFSTPALDATTDYTAYAARATSSTAKSSFKSSFSTHPAFPAALPIFV